MQWSSIFHIKTLFDGMVTDFHMFSYRGPLQRYWSSIFQSRPSTKVLVIDLSYQGPLQMQWSSIFHIKTLFDGMVIDFHMFSYRGPLQRYWSSIFHIKTLFDGMVIDFHMFSYRDPLQRYWSSIFHIEALYKCIGHRSFISRPSSMEWSLFFLNVLH